MSGLALALILGGATGGGASAVPITGNDIPANVVTLRDGSPVVQRDGSYVTLSPR